MKKITQFDKGTLKDFRTELDILLKKYEKKCGVELKSGGIRYTSNTVTVKVEGKVEGTLTDEAKTLELFSDFKFGDRIRIDQLGEVKLVGYKTRSRKYPFIVEAVHTGKRYKLSQSHIDNRVNIV